MVGRSLALMIVLGLLSTFAHGAIGEQRELSFATRPLPFTEQEATEVRDHLGLYDKSDLDQYFSISSVQVTEVDTIPYYSEFDNKSDKGLGQIIMVVDQLIALGRKIWPIIEAGRPVITSNFGPAVSVLPRTDQSPDMVAMYLMDSWEAPRQRTYLVEYKNGFGSVVISFRYTVSYQYNGQYEGAGRYLTGVDVSASQIRVSWGFQFNATSTLVSISNRGTMEDPLASATIRINYEAKSFMSEIQSSEAFHVTGDGGLVQVY